MKDLVEYIVKSLVTNPEGVLVEEKNSEEGINLLLTVDQADMGLVIGKAGQTIKAIRRLVLIRAMSEGLRVNLELKDDNRKEGKLEAGSENVEEEVKSESEDAPKEEPVDDEKNNNS